LESAHLFPRSPSLPTEAMTAVCARGLVQNKSPRALPAQLYHWFHHIVHVSGIVRAAHVTIHQFRHRLSQAFSFLWQEGLLSVTKLLECKENRLVDVSAYLGHRHVATTIDPYWHVDPRTLHQRLLFPWQSPLSLSNSMQHVSPMSLHRGGDERGVISDDASGRVDHHLPGSAGTDLL